jgi:hypothetical protein
MDLRLTPDVQRYGWERDWLKENQFALLMATDPEPNALFNAPERAVAGAVMLRVPDAIENESPAHALAAIEAGGGRETAAENMGNRFTEMPLLRLEALTPALGTPVPLYGVSTSEDQQVSASEPLSRQQLPPTPLKAFGVWRDDMNVDVAKRLPSPTLAALPQLLSALQRWIRQGNAELRSVLINGKAALAEPAETAGTNDRNDRIISQG